MCFVIPTAPSATKFVDSVNMPDFMNVATIDLAPVAKLRVVDLERRTCLTVLTKKVAPVRMVGARTIRDAGYTAGVISLTDHKEGVCRRQVSARNEDKGEVGHYHRCELYKQG